MSVAAIEPTTSTAAAKAKISAPPITVRASVAARMLGVSRSAWDRLVASGKTPAPVRLGQLPVWSIDELRAWIVAGAPDRQAWAAIRATKAGD